MLRGRLDIATRTHISGWAQDERLPHQPIALLVIDNDVLLDRVVANRLRPDLAAGGIGDGRHGFDLRYEGGLPGLGQHLIRVVRERDGAELAASPAVIAPANAFDAHETSLLQSVLDGLATTTAIDAAIVALSAQIDRLAARRLAPAGTKPRALVIDTTMPAPGRDAGSNAILSHVEALIRLGYAVSFAAADGSAPPRHPGIDWRSRPVHRSVEEVLTREAGRFDLVYLHRLDAAAGYMPLVRLHQPRARVIYSVADLHHLRLARRGYSEREPALIAHARKVRDTELAVAGAADAVITHSHTEAAILRRTLPAERVVVAPWLVTPAKTRAVVPQATIGFIGHFGHAPNLAAAHRLAFEIMPRLRAAIPAITCLIAGSAMPPAMRQWAATGVQLLGAVDDLAAFFARLTLTVAPMRFGAGIKGKLLDSLAAGVPCAATSVAIEGLDWPAKLAHCVADDDEGLSAAILALCSDAALHRQSVLAGRAMIKRDWSVDRVDAALAQALASDAAAAG
ncbi:glycosyltransferase [Acidiphilium sp. PA]|uniref:glycosyltransferase n=1 Tax=Acidiphilium sp. PA TaxID=2871705 RepID=UPI002242CA00|nr:glycosyltransferase [Acidiphilium sp. PA]MCW8305910.1 glycosyltransferase [Acidiphilium sp. PA]